MPTALSNALTKKKQRKTIRWFRKDNKVFVKWCDTKDVCALSTRYAATGEDKAEPKKKVNGKLKKN